MQVINFYVHLLASTLMSGIILQMKIEMNTTICEEYFTF